MDKIRLVPAQHKHIGRIARRLRDVDRRECEAMGRSGKHALRAALGTSSKAWTALVDGQPEAMFGVVVESVLDGTAIPWFLGTDEVYRHGRALLMWGPGMVDRLCAGGFTLYNYVSTENSKAIRLLNHWGFAVSSEVQFFSGVAFYRFERSTFSRQPHDGSC